MPVESLPAQTVLPPSIITGFLIPIVVKVLQRQVQNYFTGCAPVQASEGVGACNLTFHGVETLKFNV